MPKLFISTLERIMRHVLPEPMSGCWLWLAGEARGGYAKVKIRKRSLIAHKALYELVRGPVPEGLQLDHLCRVRCCVNPAHLEPVTALVNQQRGMGNANALAALKVKRLAQTTCKNGHVFTGVTKQGYRTCKHCIRDAMRRLRARHVT